jgi:DNA (cytosine-5)-methyltransferase 3A
MNVLSLFDGISVGRLALERCGIEVDKYYASEIDENAIRISAKNYSNIIRLGDVTKVNYNYDVLHTESFGIWNCGKIDLLIGGSPCSSWSFSGKRQGLEGESGLFLDYVRLLNEVKPTYFLLENVNMKKEWLNLISNYLNVNPIFINSSLLSAQDRKRWYWTNIPNIPQIENKNIYFKDILENNVDSKYYLKESIYNRFEMNNNYLLKTEKSNVIGKFSDYQGDRVFDINGKASSLSANGGNNGGGGCNIIINNGKFRRITPLEAERLQTLPDNYTEGISETARYKVIGNSWTVDIISHILKNIK